MAKTVTSSGKVNYNTKPDPKGVLYLRDLPPMLKKKFKVTCAETGISMTDAVAVFMELFTKGNQGVTDAVVKLATVKGLIQ